MKNTEAKQDSTNLIIPLFGRLKYEDCWELQARLDFRVRPGLINTHDKKWDGGRDQHREKMPLRGPANLSGDHNHGDDSVHKVKRTQ